MMKKFLTRFLALLLFYCNAAVAQEPPFLNEIQAFKKEDSLQQPASNAILFVGSSSFRLWKDVREAFPKHTIINRGFGGSTLVDVIRYADDTITPYHPKQIVVYCGENDVAASDTVSGETVFRRFVQLFEMVRRQQPDVSVVYVSIKPSPSRWQLRDKMKKGNELIKVFLRSKTKTAYVDVWTPMLDSDGKPRAELFGPDNLHMTAKGYAIWQEKIEPYLLKN